mgnify:FL=1
MHTQRAKNVWKYVLPTMASSICMFLFTIVDGIFVGRGVGTDALGAVNIAFPVVMILNALYLLTTVGGVTVVAIRIGRGDIDGANQVFMHSVIFTAAVGLVFTLAGTVFSKEIVALLGANDTFLKLGSDYLFWYTLFVIPAGLTVCFQGFCRNDGSPGLSSIAVISTAFCNIFLDWLFIFPLGMGTAGAAIATGISQTVSMFIVLLHFLRKKGDLRIFLPKPDGSLFRKIVLRGLPESIAQFATPVMTVCLNLVLAKNIGDIGINAFSVMAYVSTFAIAIFFGTSEGLQPLFGQSYGAKNEKDLGFYFRTGLIINVAGSVVATLLVILFCRPICSLFGADKDTLDYIVKSMPMFAWAFIPMAVNVMISAYLYSTKRSNYAIVVNILRSFIVNMTIILLLPRIFGAGIIWYAFGIYELIVAVAAIVLSRYSEQNGIVFK